MSIIAINGKRITEARLNVYISIILTGSAMIKANRNNLNHPTLDTMPIDLLKTSEIVSSGLSIFK